jgi:uncharacterized tellurite resistance protein B-like protein
MTRLAFPGSILPGVAARPKVGVVKQDRDPLLETVRLAMPEAEEGSVRIVVAVAGLLGAVAYADGVLDPAEERQIRDSLGRIAGLTASGPDAILQVLRSRLVQVATIDLPHFTRALRELAVRETRVEVLGVLLGLAAADGTISNDEVTKLRNIAQALGLTQDDYNALQEEHRDKLAILRR